MNNEDRFIWKPKDIVSVAQDKEEGKEKDADEGKKSSAKAPALTQKKHLK